MSIDALLPAATEALDGVIAAIRDTAARDDPAILHRIGKLDTILAATRAAAEQGHADEAALLASGLLRDIAHDFPAHATAPSDLLGEDRRRRALARRLLEAAE